MLHQFRTRWLAGGGALLLVLSMSGLVAAASLVSDTTTHTQDATQPAGDSTPSFTFTDLNGNGIDDTCETAVTPDSVAAAAALTAADLDGNGTISVSEAARSGWIGGANCNHGGYVSSVAKTSTDTCDTADQNAGDTNESADDTNESAGRVHWRPGRGHVRGLRRSGYRCVDDHASTTTTPCAPASTDPSTDTSDPAPAGCPVVAPCRAGQTAQRRSSTRHRTPMARRSRPSPSQTRSEARTAITAVPSARPRTVPSRTRKRSARPTSRSTTERATAGRTDRSDEHDPQAQPPGRSRCRARPSPGITVSGPAIEAQPGERPPWRARRSPGKTVPAPDGRGWP